MSLFLQILESLNLPKPQTEYKFHNSRKWRFDFAYPEHKIAIEQEGGVWIQGRHNRATGFLNDIEKYNEAGLLGWRIFRITPQMITDGTAINLVEKLFNENNNS